MRFEEHFEKIGKGYIILGLSSGEHHHNQFDFEKSLTQEELLELEKENQEEQMRVRYNDERESQGIGIDDPDPDESNDPQFFPYHLGYKIYNPHPLEEEIELTIGYNNQEYKFKLYENQNKTESEQPDYIGKIKKFNGFTGHFGFECEETTLIVEGRLKRKITTSDIINIILLKPI